jgi:hypothetical protein
MSVEVVKGEEYTIEYHRDTRCLMFRGTIRLQSSEDYLPIVGLMQLAQAECAATGALLTMDFHQLEFLNSSGINSISKFVIAARKEDRIGLAVRGNKDVYWQQKSLSNLQKLWSKVTIAID